jgi:hypothetical protein
VLVSCFSENAVQLVADVQSVAGSSLERDGGLVYCLIDASQVREAVAELKVSYEVDTSFVSVVG